jgi:hypothetical protein
VYDVVQRSPEWYALRLGLVTGSCAPSMLTEPQKGKSGESAARRNLRVALALERLTGEADEETFTSRDVKRGEDLEATARRVYESATGRLLQTVGFIKHHTLAAGCSPDALWRGGVIDFKCPRPGNHLEYLRADQMPLEYRRQLTHNIWITGAQWGEMVSYCPKFPEPLRLCVHRIECSTRDLEAYELTLRAFLLEVDVETKAIATMANRRTVLEKAVA